MKLKAPKEGEHDETLTIGARTYACRFRQDARAGYHATCAALPSVFAYGPDLAAARMALRQEIEGVISERERRYEIEALTWGRAQRYEENVEGILQSEL